MNHDPEDFARALLHDRKIDQVYDVEQLAKELRLTIREVNSKNFEGALVRIPQSLEGFIALKGDIREPGRRRFTIAHEVGHFVLPNHGQDDCYCKSSNIESWRKDGVRRQEYEANRFASELLLPAKKLYPLVNEKDLTLDRVKGFARHFETSLTAAAVKSIDVTEESCAVVWSVGQEIKWVRKSESFNYFIPYMRLGLDCLAGQLFENDTAREMGGEVFATSWIESDEIERESKLWEESIAMPFYDSVLTILTL